LTYEEKNGNIVG